MPKWDWLKISEERKRAKLVGFAISTLLVLSGAAYLMHHFNSGTATSSRALKHLENANQALAAGDPEAAIRLASAANQLDPGNIAPLRTILFARASSASPHLLPIVAQLFVHPDATTNDRSRSLAVLLELSDFRLFQRYYVLLPPEEQTLPNNLYLKAGYYAAQGNAKEALKILNEGPADDSRFRILRASLESLAADDSVRTAGQRDLASQVRSRDPNIADHAYRKIAAIPNTIKETEILLPAAKIWMAGRNIEDVQLQERLILATLEFLSLGHSPKADDLVRETVDLYGKSDPLLIANWLLSLNRWDAAYQFATDQGLGTEDGNDRDALNRALFEIRLQSLAGASRWEERLDILNEAPPSTPPMHLAMTAAVSNKHLGRHKESQRNWQEARNHAEISSSRRNSFLELYRVAAREGETDLAVRAAIEASKNPRGVLPPTKELTGLLLFLAETERYDDLIALSEGLFQRESFSVPLLGDAIYLRELTSNRVEGAEDVLGRLLERNPEAPRFKATLILYYFNRGQFDEALSVAEELTSRHRIEDLPPTESVIIAGAYRLAGKKHFAAERDLEKNMAAVMDIERRVFEKWFEEQE